MNFFRCESGADKKLTHHNITVSKTSSSSGYTDSVSVQGKIVFAIINTYYNGSFITVGGSETDDAVFGYTSYQHLTNAPAFIQTGNSATFNVGTSQTFQTVNVDYWSEE